MHHVSLLDDNTNHHYKKYFSEVENGDFSAFDSLSFPPECQDHIFTGKIFTQYLIKEMLNELIDSLQKDIDSLLPKWDKCKETILID